MYTCLVMTIKLWTNIWWILLQTYWVQILWSLKCANANVVYNMYKMLCIDIGQNIANWASQCKKQCQTIATAHYNLYNLTVPTVPSSLKLHNMSKMAQCSVCTRTAPTINAITHYNLYNGCHNDSESSDCDLVTHVSLSFPLCIALHSKVSRSQCKPVHHILRTYMYQNLIN